MSWYQAPLWDLRPDITSCRNVAVWNLRSWFCGAPLWREDGSAICSVITQWSESLRTLNHTLLSHLRLPNLEGQVPVFISPRNRVAQLCPRALGSLYVVSYDSQGCGGGILTLPLPGGTGPCIAFWNMMIQSKVKSMSKSRYDRRPVNQYVVVPSPLGIKGVRSEKFQFDIRRCTLRRNFLLPLGGLHEKHAVQRGIWVPTQHLLWDQRKPRKTLIELAGRRTFQIQTDFLPAVRH
jgi:hypothetical protein